MYVCMYVCMYVYALYSSSCTYVCMYIWLHVSSTPLRERVYDMQCIYACMHRCITFLNLDFMKFNNFLFACSKTAPSVVYMNI